jgi:PKD repeat protein
MFKSQTITVNPSTPTQVNNPVTAAAPFTDPGTSDTHTAYWNWGDGNTTTGTVTESNSSGSVTGTHIYSVAGVYTIILTVTDNDNASSSQEFQYISVYNPTPQGLFAANRIFTSPAGAYPQNSNLTGQVKFGVTAKYQGTSINGDVSMDFQQANLEFDATSLTVLVTSNGQATLRGTGTINGSGNYSLLVTGLDGAQDAIRFQLKDQSQTVIYDSQIGAADTVTPTTLVTGQIIIH